MVITIKRPSPTFQLSLLNNLTHLRITVVIYSYEKRSYLTVTNRMQILLHTSCRTSYVPK
jgi:hypothetical protein